MKTGTRLQALDSIISISGKTIESIAVELGLTKNTLMVWRRKDDMIISRMAEMAALCGYQMSIGICKGVARVEELIQPVNPSKPISFFTKMLPYYGMSIDDVAKKTGTCKGTITGWLYSEKCTLVDILSLVKKLGMRMYIDFTPLQEENKVPEGTYVVSSVKERKYFYQGE